MERYAKYKPTGIAWLPEVPEGWEIVKIKRLFFEHTEQKGNFELPLLSFSKSKGIVPFSSINEKEHSAKDLSKYKILRKGQLLENRLQAWNGMFAVAKIEGCVSPDYSVFDASELAIADYYAYVFRTPLYIKQFSDASRGIGDGFNRLYTPQFGAIDVPLLPLATQRAIVAYLDERCGKIDRLVTLKERQIELLKEKRKALVAHVVTHGLDPNAELVESGVSWLGKVPKGWKVRKMKYIFAERSEKGHPNEQPLCSTQAHGVIPQSIYEHRVVVVNRGFESLKFVQVGDFVISLRSFQGGIEVAHYQGIISAAYTILRLHDPQYSLYYRWLFKSNDFIQLLQTCVMGIREGQNINYSKLSRKCIPLPPLATQRAIVAYLDERCGKIDRLVALLERSIELLKERRVRLVSDVVTGKVKV